MSDAPVVQKTMSAVRQRTQWSKWEPAEHSGWHQWIGWPFLLTGSVNSRRHARQTATIEATTDLLAQ